MHLRNVLHTLNRDAISGLSDDELETLGLVLHELCEMHKAGQKRRDKEQQQKTEEEEKETPPQ